MKCGIDADVLVYEIAFCCQFPDEDDPDKLVILDFDRATELLDQRIREIEEECWADEPSTLYLTNDPKLNKIYNRWRKTQGLKPIKYKPNFREHIAVSKPYKGTRTAEKPFHRDNLRAYMIANYDVVVANGYEADDLLCIDGYKRTDFTICTRDKDLRMVEGTHFGWPCGKQPQFGPMYVDHTGEIRLVKGNKEIKGHGIKFFWSQMITGDGVDNIPGLPRGGPVLAFNKLNDLTEEDDMRSVVEELYEARKGEDWKEFFDEQASLLWMSREYNDEGDPKVWRDYG